MPKIILATIITVIVLTVAIFGINFLITNKNIFPAFQSTSPDILYLTNPVTTFSGTIDAVHGNTITVSQEMTLTQSLTAPANPSQAPAKPQTKKITYSVLVNDKTIINQSPETIPYLFKQVPVGTASAVPAMTGNLQINDLKTGQFITINSTTDLRTLLGNQFTATLINVSSKTFFINGKITNINAQEITVLGTTSSINMANNANLLQPTKEKEYTIVANQDTEISSINSSADLTKISQPIKYSFSDLKANQQVMVYTNDDPGTTNKATALLIRPILTISATTPIASPSAVPSSKPSPGSQKLK